MNARMEKFGARLPYHTPAGKLVLRVDVVPEREPEEPGEEPKEPKIGVWVRLDGDPGGAEFYASIQVFSHINLGNLSPVISEKDVIPLGLAVLTIASFEAPFRRLHSVKVDLMQRVTGRVLTPAAE